MSQLLTDTIPTAGAAHLNNHQLTIFVGAGKRNCSRVLSSTETKTNLRKVVNQVTLKLRANELYTSDGTWLKTIHCPKKLTPDGLRSSKHGQLTCAECNHTVFDTDYMSENQLVELLTNNPDSCLKINLANPIFERIDCRPERQGEEDANNW